MGKKSELRLRIESSLTMVPALVALLVMLAGNSSASSFLRCNEGCPASTDLKRQTTDLTSSDRARIKATLNASRKGDRDRLRYAKIRGRLILFYGPPTRGRRNSSPSFRVLGKCNEYFRNGDVSAGTGLMCPGWIPTNADRAAQS